MSNNPFTPVGWTTGELLPLKTMQTSQGLEVRPAVPMALQDLWSGAVGLAREATGQVPPRLEGNPLGLNEQATLMALAAPDVMGIGAADAAALRSFGAWHGTPHTFDEFKNEAIGTGEGAQAYGWGHYVAGNPKVAESYKQPGGGMIQAKPSLEIGGQQFSPNDFDVNSGEWHAANHMMDMMSRGADPAVILANAEQKSKSPSYFRAEIGPDRYNDYLNALRNWTVQGIKYNPPSQGHLLEVHVLPDESEFLDWDKPLGEQPQNIQNAISKASNITNHEPNLNATGEDYYRGFARSFGGFDYPNTREEAASKALHNAGIPGIKYLDQGSRAAGQGTSNYVVFDPSNLRIVGRDGQTMTPVDYDPFEVSK